MCVLKTDTPGNSVRALFCPIYWRMAPITSQGTVNLQTFERLKFQCIAKKAPYACGNFHERSFTRFQKPQQLGRARKACSSHVRQRAGPALLQAAAETTGIWGRKKAVRQVRHCKEVGLQEWPLAGQATVPSALYGISPRMSLRQRVILSKSLHEPARVALTVYAR